jgi:hypothetical protein
VKCALCSGTIEQGEDREFHGQSLCEDCYMDALSPVRTCDPWAVHSAKSLALHAEGGTELTPIQSEILQILEESGGMTPEALLDRLEGKLTHAQLQREFASLRHMEKARGEKKDGKIFLRCW